VSALLCLKNRWAKYALEESRGKGRVGVSKNFQKEKNKHKQQIVSRGEGVRVRRGKRTQIKRECKLGKEMQ